MFILGNVKFVQRDVRLALSRVFVHVVSRLCHTISNSMSKCVGVARLN